MKHPTIPTLFLLALLSLALFAPAALCQEDVEEEITISGLSDEELEEALQLWREDYVRYIITGWEEEEWGNLKTTRQKLEFIEYFWKMRDPDPTTEVNEYRKEYQQRWNYVNKHFTAGKHGWRTDRGRIYLILGPPNDIERNPMGRNRSERPSEIWYYNNIANKKLPAQVQIAFVDFMGYGDYEIVSDLERTAKMFSERFGISMNNLDAYALRRMGEINLADDAMVSQMFDETVVRNPEILSAELFDLQTELQYIAEVPSLRVKKASERVRTEISSADVSFAMDANQVPGSDGSVILPVTLAIPLNNASYIEDPQTGRTYKLNIYARLHNTDENQTYEDKLEIPVAREVYQDPANAGRFDNYLYQFLFVAPPGEYSLNVTLRDELSKNIGFEKQTVVLTDPAEEGILISDVIVADMVEQLTNVKAAQAASVAPFKIADRRVVPNVTKIIDVDKQDEFQLFFHLSNFETAGETGKPDITLQYFIYRDGELISKTPEASVETSYQKRASVESRFNARSLGAGNFRIIAVVTDNISGKQVKDDVTFRIIRSNIVG